MQQNLKLHPPILSTAGIWVGGGTINANGINDLRQTELNPSIVCEAEIKSRRVLYLQEFATERIRAYGLTETLIG